MDLTNFRFDLDGDGVALLTWDMPGRSMNVITPEVMSELSAVIERVASDEAVRGCVIVSGKEGFSGGADLAMLQRLGADYARLVGEQGEEAAMGHFLDRSSGLSRLYRRLETCGKPFVAAIHGVCLGGAFELALACHHRVASDDETTRVGLPEVKVGLFPGAGGTQRVARLMPTAAALQMLLRGEQIRPAMARAQGLLHEVVKREALIEAARTWMREGGKGVAAWDEKGFKPPSGKVYSPAGAQVWPAAAAILRRETGGNYPAAGAILQVVHEGLQLGMDLALRIESRHFARILRTPEAAAMIRTLFLSKGELDKGARRPAGLPSSRIGTVGVVGAGFMGAGIAYVSALAGLDVVLLDRDVEAAEKGRAYSHKLMTAQVSKGRAKSADREALLARIRPTADYSDLAACDLVIEAVFEDSAVKAEVIARVEAAIGPDCVFASNTSTLPITGLAAHSARPESFIGVHFFSPVERMMLVEVIRAKGTGDRALGVALDYVRLIRKTPIVVNDARGFYANRCVGAYIREGHLMLMEGVPPAMIETLARGAGMPVGPLSLNDEVALDLALRIVRATAAGGGAVHPVQAQLLERMVEREGRLGRKNGRGFYDYPEGGRKALWPGLRDLPAVRLDPDAVDREEVGCRLLAAQALEAARSLEEGVLTDPREGDVGAVLGFGYAPFTGGPLSHIDGMGAAAFVALCERLAERHGPRFQPGGLLTEMASRGETFYERFAPTGTREAA